jgi:ELWxxDGT repeat protein
LDIGWNRRRNHGNRGLRERRIAGAVHGLWFPTNFAARGNKVIFTAGDPVGGASALWITDGTAAGTTEIGGLKNAGISGQGNDGLLPGNFVSIGTKVLFDGNDPSGVNALWVTDGTAAGTFELGGVNNVGVAGAPAAGLDPSLITASGGIAYFSSPDSTGTERLWESDGTVAGTHVVAAGPTGLVSDPTDLTAATGGMPLPPPMGINGILFQNASGQAAEWEVSGATLTTSALLGPNPGPNWKDVAFSDFNDDTHPDILLQNINGAVAIWEANGTRVTNSAVVANPGPNWQVVGTGDFNDDGDSDILLQNTSGSVAIWDMNGTDIKSSAVVADPGPNWHAIATGDFDDDGLSDILLQNTNGAVAIWEMNGTEIKSSAVLASPGASWHAIGTGDFTGDGHSDDILLQNTNGAVAVWELNANGTEIMSSAALANPGPSWHALGTNGGSDILLQSTSGQTALWDLSGTSLTGSGAVSANAGPNWRAVGLT